MGGAVAVAVAVAVAAAAAAVAAATTGAATMVGGTAIRHRFAVFTRTVITIPRPK